MNRSDSQSCPNQPMDGKEQVLSNPQASTLHHGANRHARTPPRYHSATGAAMLKRERPELADGGGADQPAAQLWQRLSAELGGQHPAAPVFMQHFSAKEMRRMLGSSKNRSKEIMAKMLTEAIRSGGIPLPPVSATARARKSCAPVAAAGAPPPALPGGRRAASGSPPSAEDSLDDMAWKRTDPCTQTLAKGWYTPKSADSTAGVTTSGGIGDVVWCKLGKAPWWPALLAEPVTDSQLADKKLAHKRGATAFVIFYPYTLECSYEWLRPADLRSFDPCQLRAMAGNARQYSQPGWEFSHMAQALADASAEAIANMSLEKLREVVHRGHTGSYTCNCTTALIICEDVSERLLVVTGDSYSLMDAEGGSQVSTVIAATHLRAVLAQRARQCRTQIFGDPALGALDVSNAAADDVPKKSTPETEDSPDENELTLLPPRQKLLPSRQTLLPPRQTLPPARHAISSMDISSKSCPVGRLDKHVRDYMVDVLQSWSANNPDAKMPSKEEKLDLIGRCCDATGCDVTIRHLEYWFWQRNKLRNKQLKSSGSGGYTSWAGSDVLPPSVSAPPQQTGVFRSVAESEAGKTRARIQTERFLLNAKAERQRFEVPAPGHIST